MAYVTNMPGCDSGRRHNKYRYHVFWNRGQRTSFVIRFLDPMARYQQESSLAAAHTRNEQGKSRTCEEIIENVAHRSFAPDESSRRQIGCQQRLYARLTETLAEKKEPRNSLVEWM